MYNMGKLTKEKLEELRNIPWTFGNNILYDMCKNNPEHTDPGIILAKVWLIGRAYSASIERGAGAKIDESKKSGEDFFINTIVNKIKMSGIDDWLKKLKGIDKIDLTNYETILEIHNKLTKLFNDISGLHKRSLASKYLHFHFPELFFIYDSLAKKELNKIVKTRFKLPKSYDLKFDKEYTSFVVKCIQFRDEQEKELNIELSARDIDLWLLSSTPNISWLADATK